MARYRYSSESRLFHDRDLLDFLEKYRTELRARILSETADYLLNVDETKYLDFLEEQFKVEPLNIDFDGLSVTPHEEGIPGARFPSIEFDTDPQEVYRKQVFTFHLPYAGLEELLKCSPSFELSPVCGYLSQGCICFDIIDLYEDPERVRRDADETLKRIRQINDSINRQVNQYNTTLRAKAKDLLDGRRKELMNRAKVATSLGVPIRKSSNLPETFTIPTIRKKAVAKPTAIPGKVAEPVPTLSDEVYQEILQTIHDTGKAMERHPNTYLGKDEEALRDNLIFILEPRFEGSTTGETFNKSGRTDLLIRYEKSNVFVAECKFWRGKEGHLKAISQLLGYLTWRDSKTALIYFVDRKEITPVLAEIAKSTEEHPCYVKPLGKKDDSWQAFEFHLPDDPDCKIKLAILAFHVPPIQKQH